MILCFLSMNAINNGLGVILDWVPGHFCKDSHGLYKFDGSYLYDYPNEEDRENPVWGTANFDLGEMKYKAFSSQMLFFGYSIFILMVLDWMLLPI